MKPDPTASSRPAPAYPWRVPAEQLDDLTALTSLTAGGLYPRVDVRASCGSTNAELIAGAADLPAGTVLLTDHQTSGRGRFARPWQSPKGATVALSVLLRPETPAEHWSWLPHLAGIAVAEGIGRVTGIDVALKWPNDALVDGQKICGILLEGAPVPAGESPALVLGIGLNIAFTADDLPVPTATSLALQGYLGPRTEVVAAVLESFRRRYWQWRDGDLAGIRARYTELCATVGARVRLELPEGAVTGTAEGVDDSGRLLLRTHAGLGTYSAGDVVHLRRH